MRCRLFTIAVCLFLISAHPLAAQIEQVLPTQTPDEIYQIDYELFRTQGNHPGTVAYFINGIGIGTLGSLERGTLPDFPNRQEVMNAMVEVYGPKETRLEKSIESLPFRNPKLSGPFDLRTAEQTLTILGPQFCQKYLVGNMTTTLAVKTGGIDDRLRFRLPTKAFRLWLDLTDQQNAQIAEAISAAQKKFHKQTANAAGELLKNSEANIKKMKTGMNPKQVEYFDQLIGPPFQWHLEFDYPLWFRENRRSKRTIFGSKLFGIREKNNRFADQFSDQEIERHGVEKFETFTFVLFTDPYVLKQLDLTEEQKEKWKSEYKPRLDEMVLALPEDNEKRIEQVLHRKTKYPKSMTNFLTAEQLERFCQMELVARLIRRGDRNLVHPSFNKHLKIIGKRNVQNPMFQREFGLQFANCDPGIFDPRHFDDAVERHESGHNSADDQIRLRFVTVYQQRFTIQTELERKLESILTEPQLKIYAGIGTLQSQKDKKIRDLEEYKRKQQGGFG